MILEGPLPIPAKCSAQLRRLLQSHSITRPAVRDLNGGLGSSNETSATSSTEPRRPIYPNLPYSPYSSPVSSPRVRRKPLRETTRVNSTVQSDGEYVQLNQYKLEQAIGQVCINCYIVDTRLVCSLFQSGLNFTNLTCQLGKISNMVR